MKRLQHRLAALYVVGVLGLAGCPATPARQDAASLRDFHIIFDLLPGPPDDMTVGPDDDLTMSGSDDAGVPDLKGGGSDGGGGGCIQLASWPAVQSEGGYDSMNQVSYTLQSDGANPPFNVFSVEDWQSSGETHPKVVTFDSTVTYNAANACEVCALIEACTSAGCNNKFFAQAGTVTVTRADRTESSGRMIASGTNVKLVEWDFNSDTPVANGACYLIASLSVDVTWSLPTDGGVAADLKGVDLKGASFDLKAPADLATGNADLSTLACNPVINEVQVAGAAGAADEFVEIFNPCSGSINMSGWKLDYRSAANNKGTGDTLAYSFTQTITSNGYLLIGGSSWAGAKDGALVGGLAGGGGALGLRNGGGVLVDSVAYATLTATNDFTEGTMPAPNPTTSKSIARTPNGTDTNHNDLDWKLATTPTPKAKN